ncbi:MAG: hypothetical protein ABSH04_04875, partial [Acidimicrobiales bacterium]
MTIEGPQTEQGSSAELISSKAPSSAELWDEVLQRLAEVQSMAPSSEATWNDVLQRIAEVQRAHTKLATAVDHLGAVLSSALVTEPRQDLAGRGIAAEFAVDADMPPLLVPKLPDIEVGEARDETPWLPEQSMAEALPTIEERETDGGQAPEATSEDGQPWLTEFAIFAPTDEHEVEEEQPWLAELALAETPSETTAMEVPESEALQTRPEIEHEQPILAEPVLAQTPAETVEEEEEPVVHVDAETAASFAPDEPHGALSGVSIFAPGRVVDMSPQVMDALLAAEFGEATVRLMDSEALTLDDLLAEEFAPTDQGTEARGAATPLLPLPTSEAEIHPPPSPPLPPPPADLLPPPLGDLPPSPFDSPLSTGESTLPVEPPPIPEPVAMTDTGD